MSSMHHLAYSCNAVYCTSSKDWLGLLLFLSYQLYITAILPSLWFLSYLDSLSNLICLVDHNILRNRNHNLQASKAPLESQAQGTSLFTSAASSQRGCPKE